MPETAPAPRSEPVALPTDASDARAMAARLVAQCEGFRSQPYQDTGGRWTIGYGTTWLDGGPVTADTPACTRAQAEAWLEAELSATADDVDRELTGYQPVCVRAACYSFAYNVGVGAFAGSDVLRLLNAGNLAGAANALLGWCHDHDPETGALVTVPGLLNRRRLERAVMLGEVEP